MKSKRRKELDLFNFSFLDILACVIGLLIFILAIVVVSGSSSANRQTDGRLANAEHQLEKANDAAILASTKRTRAEQMLSERAHNLTDPQSAVSAVRGEIGLLNSETADLDASSETLSSNLDDLRKALAAMQRPQIVDSSIVAIQRQLRELDEETIKIINQTAQMRQQAQANVAHVDFLVPHRQEVNRSTLWVEVSGDQIWCIDSQDYDVIPVDSESVRYSRHLDAVGSSITAIVTDRIEPPPALLNANPNETVLDIALHSDGYPAFRKLREWAWKKGFGVDWVPHEGDSIVLTHTQHVYLQ